MDFRPIVASSTLLALSIILMTSCSHPETLPHEEELPRDVHSYGNPAEVRVKHVSLDLEVAFDEHSIKGTAILALDRRRRQARRLVLDSRALQIDETEVSADGNHFKEAGFEIGLADSILGAPLTIDLAEDSQFVRIRYSTSPSGATALQWLSPEQTEGRQHPFLYTQGEAIHTRSWIPLQDSPGVRVTWDAHVRVPEGMRAVMSAVNCPDARYCSFRMEHPVPPYLIALAVGDLHFKATGPRTGVWAEPSVLDKAAAEFSDTEKMMAAAEKLYGAYRWKRYDLLVLPPSFPFGGMENPCLTFVTPTVLAGDKSLVSLIAHELAHSWSGNLVTNATWSDFWLNEGYTVYFERRILEELYGAGRARMEASLGYRELLEELKSHPPRDQILEIDLKGRDPDEGMTEIPYEKGALFLLAVEQAVGRPRLDAWLREYFDRFAFRGITTKQSLDYMQNRLFAPPAPDDKTPAPKPVRFPVADWVHQPGLPRNAPSPESEAFAAVDAAAADWLRGRPIETAHWSTHEWLRFLHSLPEKLDAHRMQALDRSFHLTATGNNEILAQWLLMAVRNRYAPANQRLEEFLTTVGRRKYLKPLYAAMDPRHAQEIYTKARPLYHPVTQTTLDQVIGSHQGESKKR